MHSTWWKGANLSHQYIFLVEREGVEEVTVLSSDPSIASPERGMTPDRDEPSPPWMLKLKDQIKENSLAVAPPQSYIFRTDDPSKESTTSGQ